MPRLSAEAIRQAAGYLAEAMTSGNTLAPFPPELAPTTVAQALRMQSLLLAELGLSPVGVRLAPWPGAAGAGPAVAGPVLGPRLLHAPAARPPLHRAGATAALIAQLAKPLPAREKPWTARELIPRIATLHPAIDLAASRYTEGAPDLPCHIADLAGLGAVILGRPARAGWQEAIAAPRQARVTTGEAGTAWRGPVDVRGALVAAAEAARAAGGLPAGAVLVAAGLSPALPEGPLTLTIAGLGRAEIVAG